MMKDLRSAAGADREGEEPHAPWERIATAREQLNKAAARKLISAPVGP